MPIDYSQYPPNWNEIRARVLERAGHRCEECDVANHLDGARGGDGVFRELTAENVMHEWWNGKRIFRIVLTIAHTCSCKPKCGHEHHVKALCQRCHLRLDLPHHIQKRRQGVFKRKAIGELFA